MPAHKLSRNTIKLLAFLFMFIDHIGAIFFPAALWWRTIGRLSFPLFAYLISDGMDRTRCKGKMIARLFILALISQIPYSLAFYNQIWSWNLNIFFTLGLGAVSCFIAGYPFKNITVKQQTALKILFIFLFVGCAQVLHTDYSGYGVLMIALLYCVQHSGVYMKLIEIQRYLLFFTLFILTCLYVFLSMDFLQMSCVLSGLLMPHSRKRQKPWGKWAYLIYPLHLLFFWLLRKM